ncbi:MAG: MerC domain-containing protein [Acidobacteria bacterium]|nr:MerC domain-containing protein [Acidobacteriota bacterium]MDW7983936.1 MerC domain-containing protein [Acidobacteriota bacterium]
MQLSVDRMGMVVSTVCAVHCAVGPFIFLLLPWVETYESAWTEGLERVLIGSAVGIAAVAFGVGYRTHRDARVGLWFLTGFLLIGLGHGYLGTYGQGIESATVIAGAACLILGHVQNQRLCRCAGCPSCKVRQDVPVGRGEEERDQFGVSDCLRQGQRGKSGR